MKYQRMRISQFRKFKNQIDFKFGNKITVISGINGIGKSSLLALMASTSGTKDKRLNGQDFQPEFGDLFKISPTENYLEYRLFIEFDKKIGSEIQYYLTKRISFKNDERSKRGIRVIPRTYSPLDNENREVKVTVSRASKDAKNTAKRVPIPTVYVSLSRLVPLGETDVKSVALHSNNKIIQNKYTDFFSKCYNYVLDGSIDKNSPASFITKNKKKYLALQIKQTTNETLSVGQDNLEEIISAFTDFYALKQELGPKYHGGIVCIDEVDASLHPSAVVKLWKLMQNLSDELDLQIIVTTHSLTILKEICRLQASDEENYKLVYFKDEENPRLSNTTNYKALKADMFDRVYGEPPITKIYCEDENTKAIFSLLCNALEKIKIPSNKEVPNDIDINQIQRLYGSLTPVDILLGKDHLKALPSRDSYFKTVLIILDGDAQLKSFDPEKALKMSETDFEAENKDKLIQTAGNIVYLPSFYPPEIYIYKMRIASS